MIIKSIPDKEKRRFLEVIRYISQDAKTDRAEPQFFSHNIVGIDPEEVAQEMEENYKHRKKVKENENAFLHYVLSFHKNDTSVLKKEVLDDIVYEFIDEFNPNGMAYGSTHTDQDHLHIHLVLSANEVESNNLIYKRKHVSKKMKEGRESKPESEWTYKERTFEESKERVRNFARERAKQYARERGLNQEYQEQGLPHSYDKKYLTQTKEGREKTQAERDSIRTKNGRASDKKSRLQMVNKYKKRGKASILEQLQLASIDAWSSSGNFQSFVLSIQQKGYTLYRTKGGTINGILHEGKKYRFTTTLLPEEFSQEFNKQRRQDYIMRGEQEKRRSRTRNRNRDRGR